MLRRQTTKDGIPIEAWTISKSSPYNPSYNRLSKSLRTDGSIFTTLGHKLAHSQRGRLTRSLHNEQTMSASPLCPIGGPTRFRRATSAHKVRRVPSGMRRSEIKPPASLFGDDRVFMKFLFVCRGPSRGVRDVVYSFGKHDCSLMNNTILLSASVYVAIVVVVAVVTESARRRAPRETSHADQPRDDLLRDWIAM
ncbi:hypothetical protein EVAR_88971_1 [Eumeta japonica]|uniref:Uncharacterized protein n=1 Tax=Eumeta variegata TaxID=151549 RepID=A0A4C1VQV9_EUMVA|nr:hypothetical protein EVAR_88971_1 [Eumeta japonica]